MHKRVMVALTKIDVISLLLWEISFDKFIQIIQPFCRSIFYFD